MIYNNFTTIWYIFTFISKLADTVTKTTYEPVSGKSLILGGICTLRWHFDLRKYRYIIDVSHIHIAEILPFTLTEPIELQIHRFTGVDVWICTL